MARAAHQQGALTIAVVTRPFSFEGPQRSASAALGIENLRKEVDALIVIPNDRLLELSDRTIGIVDAFKTADTALLAGVQGITDLITSNSYIHVDFNDVNAILRGAGTALFGIGSARGEDRATQAAEIAISSPLLEESIEGAHGALINIAGPTDLKLQEAAAAVALVQKAIHPEAQIIAGGTDVLVQMREGKRAGKEFISIYGLDELRGVSIDENDSIRIGSLTSFSHITRDPIIQKYINVLGQAVDMVGGPQIRNIGTIGGNTCNGVTSADSASTLHAWEAIVELTGSEGKRLLPIRDFYIKAGLVDIHPDEIQTAIIIPKASYENTYGHYIKYSMRNAMDIATLGCSVNVRLSPDKKIIERARIAYGVAGPVPMRAERAEAAANGQPVSMETVEAFARTVLDDINPRDSWRASKAFRQHIAVETAKRCMTESIILAGGEL